MNGRGVGVNCMCVQEVSDGGRWCGGCWVGRSGDGKNGKKKRDRWQGGGSGGRSLVAEAARRTPSLSRARGRKAQVGEDPKSWTARSFIIYNPFLHPAGPASSSPPDAISPLFGRLLPRLSSSYVFDSAFYTCPHGRKEKAADLTLVENFQANGAKDSSGVAHPRCLIIS